MKRTHLAAVGLAALLAAAGGVGAWQWSRRSARKDATATPTSTAAPTPSPTPTATATEQPAVAADGARALQGVHPHAALTAPPDGRLEHPREREARMLRELEEREAGGRTLPNRAPTAHPTPTATTTAAPTASPTPADGPGPEVAEHPRIREAHLLRALEEKARREAPRPMAEPDAVLVMGGPEGEESAANAPPTWPRYAEAEPPPSPGPLARTQPRPRPRPHRASAAPPPAEQVDVPARLDTWGE